MSVYIKVHKHKVLIYVCLYKGSQTTKLLIYAVYIKVHKHKAFNICLSYKGPQTQSF